jgi:hypothetical protein
MQATHPEKLDLLVLGLVAIAALFIWHSRAGRAVRHWMWSPCADSARRTWSAIGALLVLAGCALFMAVVAGYFWTFRPVPQFSRATAEVRLHTAIAAHEKAEIRALRVLGLPPMDLSTPTKSDSWNANRPVEAPEAESSAIASATSIRPSAEPLPDWAKRPHPRQVGEPYRQVVKAGPYTTYEELDRKLGSELRSAVAEYVQEQVARRDHVHIDVPMSFINERLLVDRHDRQLAMTVGLRDEPMFESFVLLEFDNADRTDLEQMWRREVVFSRLWHTGILGGLMLTVLGTVYSYLRLDTLSKGYYSFRLRMAAAAVISAAVAVGWFFASFKVLV